MKNRILSSRLWIEGMRRLRIPGFIALGFIGILAVLVPASYHIENGLSSGTYGIKTVITTDSAVHPGLVLLPFIVAPVMALTLFSFLNRRRSSDFFHALPYTRVCIFTSFFLSIVTWLCLIAFATSALNYAAYAVFGFEKAIVPLLSVLSQTVIGSILACASVTLAMTLTGTLFSNLTVSALILYFPKISAALFTVGVTESVPIVSLERFPLWRILRYNLASSGPYLSADPASAKEIGIALVYSAVLAAVYFALSCVLFSKRKSETAGRSAPNKAVQTVFRIAITMVICMPVCTLLLFTNSDESYAILIPVLFLYSVALTVWVLWELITTKRWINVLKSLPFLGIVVALNVAVILGLTAVKNAALDFTPSPEEITKISVVSDDHDYFTPTYDMLSYMDAPGKEKPVTDRNTIRAVSGALSRAVNNIRKDGTVSADGPLDEYSVELKIESTRGTRYRTVWLTRNEYNALILGFHEGPTGAETEIPESFPFSAQEYSGPDLGEGVWDGILSTMRSELREADAGEWRDYLMNVDYDETVNVEFSTAVEDRFIRIRVPLNRKFCPKASDEYLAAIGNLKNAGYAEAVDKVDEIKKTRYDENYTFSSDFNEYIIIYDKDTGEYRTFNGLDYSDSERETVKKGFTDELPTGEQSFYVLITTNYDPETGWESAKTYVSAISPETAEYVMNNWYD